MHDFQVGQRWVSQGEPELGLGTVVHVGNRNLAIVFPGTEGVRRYAAESAPLRRVRFRIGDQIRDTDGQALQVEAVTDREGILVYQGGGAEIVETRLCDTLSVGQPDQRLSGGETDSGRLFDLRLEALVHRYRLRSNPVRGLAGGRVDLIPHQMYIAHEVAARHNPRVLLADEVGLGKTIEACMIVHRLLHCGRAERVLVLVPESLVHQWFVELMRRFNLWFTLLQRDGTPAASQPESNIFLDNQLFICSTDQLVQDDSLRAQALAADWDMLVVDEAHHLEWTPKPPSPAYQLVEQLGRRAPGLLLLTATPEQLGLESHFARLRLLDPDRYYDLDAFLSEARGYGHAAELADKFAADTPLSKAQTKTLGELLGPETIAEAQQTPSPSEHLLDALLDRHGPGRVMFRNTRAAVGGFPSRKACQALIPATDDATLARLADELAADLGQNAGWTPNYADDPRIPWLADTLRDDPESKFLLICRTQEKVLALADALRDRISAKTAVFHEGLPLVQRDRQAAWFAESDGARILLCSEIGGEGRNFQFAHHLVLWDVPLDPERLEQRIGRLDRIGQTKTIRIHLPVVQGSPQEQLVRWMHEGLNAFESSLPGGHEILRHFENAIRSVLVPPDSADSAEPLAELIDEAASLRAELAERLENGRDRLLELNSFRPERAHKLLAQTRKSDDDRTLDGFMQRILDHFGVEVEEIGSRTFLLRPDNLFSDALPGFTGEDMTITCERRKALAREDIAFFTWDHPMVTGALDLLLSSEQGNSATAHWGAPGESTLLLEAIFVLECVAPANLHADRFLPPTPMRVVIDHAGKDCSRDCPTSLFDSVLRKARLGHLLENEQITRTLIPEMVRNARTLADKRAAAVIAKATDTMSDMLETEVDRLRALQRVNPNVRQDEIDTAATQARLLHTRLSQARLRLDAVRLIWKGDR